MRIEEIKNNLSSWSKQMTSNYIGLKIRYEFSASRGVFLVSLYTDEIKDLEKFSIDVMAFEDEMSDLYGYDAPLFCDNEELFKLSSEAETIVGLKETQPVEQWALNCQLEDSFIGIFSYNYNQAA